MIRMFLFTVAVVVTILLFFPGEDLVEANRANHLRDLAESGELDPMIVRYQADLTDNPSDIAKRRALVELMLFSQNPRWQNELTTMVRELLRDEQDAQWFAEYLTREQSTPQKNAITICRNLRLVQMIPILKKLAHSQSPDVRAEATAALAEMDPENNLFLLRLAVHDSDAKVRANAISGLAELGLRQDLKRLVRLMQDKAPEVQTAAREGLVKACNSKNLQIYREYRDQTSGELPLLATIALAEQGDAECLSLLPNIIEQCDEPALRLAARVLAIHRPEVLERLLEKLSLEPTGQRHYQILNEELRRVTANSTNFAQPLLMP